ncbi:4-amino-4-deoxychorismate synthase [Aureococcus anophagefferens]|nr:4-amino-4-deoxychorismate synthase [Aureococcus anophagefferens]
MARALWLAMLASVTDTLAPPRRIPRLLLVDCFDSYTQNVAGWLAEASHARHGGDGPVAAHWPDVVAHDDPALLGALRAGAALRCAPAGLPVLGVCLGHQGLALHHGLAVERLGAPQHGLVAEVAHDDGSRLFAGMPQRFRATRYHSLTVAEPPADSELRVTARCSASGDVLALEHGSAPRFGVQFHPSPSRRPRPRHRDELPRRRRGGDGARGADIPGAAAAAGTYRKIDVGVRDPRDARAARVARRRRGGGVLPRALLRRRGQLLARRRRLRGVARRRRRRRRGPFGVRAHAARPGGGATTWHGGRAGTTAAPLLETLRAELAKLEGLAVVDRANGTTLAPPFDFALGFVGYLGYEMRRETADYSPASEALPRDRADEPDAAFVFATRAVVVDAWDGAAWILELSKTGAPLDDAWHDRALAVLRDAPAPADAPPADVGDSYEICLTTSFGGTVPPRTDPLAVYERLRSGNPRRTPRFRSAGEADCAVCCSSPERFLKVTPGGRVEAKPIKGTAARSDDAGEDRRRADALRNCVKSRAENLMIADLLRNDLARSCEPGSVRVPKLAAVESFATVHQLVTTVRGDLAAGNNALDAVAAAFPPGSMTGAPKRRTTELIDALERRDRGAYAGALGFFSPNGAADLNVVIRTAVLSSLASRAPRVEIAAGGALTALSDVADEWASHAQGRRPADVVSKSNFWPVEKKRSMDSGSP